VTVDVMVSVNAPCTSSEVLVGDVELDCTAVADAAEAVVVVSS
jgi:hypothetical protein